MEFGNNCITIGPSFICDGKVFLMTSEASLNLARDPLYRTKTDFNCKYTGEMSDSRVVAGAREDEQIGSTGEMSI